MKPINKVITISTLSTCLFILIGFGTFYEYNIFNINIEKIKGLIIYADSQSLIKSLNTTINKNNIIKSDKFSYFQPSWVGQSDSIVLIKQSAYLTRSAIIIIFNGIDNTIVKSKTQLGYPVFSVNNNYLAYLYMKGEEEKALYGGILEKQGDPYALCIIRPKQDTLKLDIYDVVLSRPQWSYNAECIYISVGNLEKTPYIIKYG